MTIRTLNTELTDRISSEEAGENFGVELTDLINKAIGKKVSFAVLISLLHGMAYQVTKDMVEKSEREDE